MPATIYKDTDADLAILQNEVCAVIGFGSQGCSFALNLRDNGAKVIVGLRSNSRSIEKARSKGFEVVSNDEAARRAQYLIMAAPDLRQPEVFESDLKKNLRTGQMIVFLHGFCIHTELIKPPLDVDVVLVAPSGPGNALRTLFTEGKGLAGLLAIHQDASGQAKQRALALAKAIGLTRAGVIETTFREETETDLFAEQAVLCGGCTELIRAGFDTLVAAGYQPEIAYLACLYELKAIVDLIQRHGIHGMRERISETAQYGDMSRGPRIINEHARAAMKQLLNEIRNGTFAKEWIAENRAGQPYYQSLLKQSAAHPIEEATKKMRPLLGETDN